MYFLMFSPSPRNTAKQFQHTHLIFLASLVFNLISSPRTSTSEWTWKLLSNGGILVYQKATKWLWQERYLNEEGRREDVDLHTRVKRFSMDEKFERRREISQMRWHSLISVVDNDPFCFIHFALPTSTAQHLVAALKNRSYKNHMFDLDNVSMRRSIGTTTHIICSPFQFLNRIFFICLTWKDIRYWENLFRFSFFFRTLDSASLVHYKCFTQHLITISLKNKLVVEIVQSKHKLWKDICCVVCWNLHRASVAWNPPGRFEFSTFQGFWRLRWQQVSRMEPIF